MFKHLVRVTLVVGLMVPSVAATRPTSTDPGDCPNDSKLIGAIELSTADAPGTWWRLTKDGLADAGIVDPDDILATLSGWFGTAFTTELQAVETLVDAVRPFDKNANNYVCAFSLRGTRAYIGDPNYALYTFGVKDDKERGNTQ